MLEWFSCRGMFLLSLLLYFLCFLSVLLSCINCHYLQRSHFTATSALHFVFLDLFFFSVCLLSILGNVIMLSVSSHQLMVSLLLCLLDWCMAVPLSLLLEPITMSFLEDRTSHKAPLLDYIYRVGSLSDSCEVFERRLLIISSTHSFPC